MSDSSTPRRLSRRTVAKGAAWAVPAVAVAVTTPSAAGSGKVPPVLITFGTACGNTGATQKGCGGDKTLQVPLTLSYASAAPVVFQITSMLTCNCATAPTTTGTGVYAGVRGIWKTPAHTPKTNQNDCTAVTASNCAGGVTNGTIVVPANPTAIPMTYWIESAATQSSSSFSTRIAWRLLAADCTVLLTGTAVTATAISPTNCDG